VIALQAAPRAGPIPLTVIGGFLGAGKTTLLNVTLERAHDRRIAVLVNDFGAICVDEALVSSRSARTISLANGCICCTLVDGLAQALLDVLALDLPPDHVLVEASGVSDPRRIAQVARADPGFIENGTLVLAAADQIRTLARDPYVGDTVTRQLVAADMVVLNKLDLVTDVEAEATRAWLRDQAGRARIVSTSDAAVANEIVLGPLTGGEDCGGTLDYRPHAGEPSGDARSTFSTRTLRCSHQLSEAALREALDALPDMVLRAKGYVCLGTGADAWHVVQAVGRRWSIVPAPPGLRTAESVLVLIGAAGALRLDETTPIARVFAPV
jgi:G3E family GTPase